MWLVGKAVLSLPETGAGGGGDIAATWLACYDHVLLNVPHRVETAQKKAYICGTIHHLLQTVESETYMYQVSRGIKKTTADQSQSSRHPFTTLDWHIVLWCLCQQGLISKTDARPKGKCLWNCQRGARSTSEHKCFQLMPDFILISIQYCIFLPGWSHFLLS